MLLYTSFPADVFQVVVSMLYRMAPFNYYSGWAVTCFSIEDQLLITLMKLRLNYRDLDGRYDLQQAGQLFQISLTLMFQSCMKSSLTAFLRKKVFQVRLSAKDQCPSPLKSSRQLE